MFERVNTPVRIEAARAKIVELLAAHAEWFFTLNSGDPQALRRSELDVAVAYGRFIVKNRNQKGGR